MMVPSVSMMVPSSVSDPYSLNTDPAKNPNPDPDPSYFLTLSDIFFLNFIITRFFHQKKSIGRYCRML